MIYMKLIVLSWVSRFVLAYRIENLAIHQRYATIRKQTPSLRFAIRFSIRSLQRFTTRFAIRFDSPFAIRLIFNLTQVGLQQFDSIHSSVQAVCSPLCLPFLPICVFPFSVVLLVCFMLVWNICRVPVSRSLSPICFFLFPYMFSSFEMEGGSS